MSPLHRPVSLCYARFKVSSAVNTKKTVFWHLSPCGSCDNRRFGERVASIIRAIGTGDLGTLTVINNRNKLRINTMNTVFFR
jgi:hypothetical protein